MSLQNTLGIYLIVEFDWPDEITPKIAKSSADLHSVITKKDWIEETMAGYGGMRSGYQCIWIFKLQSYAEIDRIFLKPDNRGGYENEVSEKYNEFFNKMKRVKEYTRHEVLFL